MDENDDYSSTDPHQANGLQLEEDSDRYDAKSRQADLVARQRSIDLSVHVYELTRDWPREEIYGLTSQIRRAAVSVAANVAEGKAETEPGNFFITRRLPTAPFEQSRQSESSRIGLVYWTSTNTIIESQL